MHGEVHLYMNLTNEAKVLIGIGAATVVILIGAVFFLSQNPETGPVSTQGNTVSDASLLIKDNSHKISTDSAKLTIIEFSDFQCPACRAAQPTVDQALIKYKDKINFVYRHFPLAQHKNAELAAQASEAASEKGKFWEFHDKLFASQNEWAEQGNPTDLFVKYATELGLDGGKLKADIESKKFEQRVKDDLNDGLKLGVNSTPTFYFNNEKYTGDFNPNNFNAKIEELTK